ncbi:hypothetical protein A3A93_05395 [Candidatus Roizmanbacteria bacterium RIFCSPLOWO2_01_FULL_38_12]|uniref:SpoVT-AbrB domain-containing protein n=1 Tax=Candidatus Roizmanbacteria bacterium RIFCSPLOWO2_01_FULL_38_12 TaxID=1802061 RepID=A0A1F7IZ54_9BACT|nr:MAG: hypothetical protein A2861_03610 [Candidatus Roizmanbacteria bacterium RIFCSPHIGHO2_01_FULL_38_15]OGK35655.1 MAG: hypothetical protein A3F59_01825 [Candidatus Roizmanbacteria bacterium RIFCSPHIGHO2_12_FULL_38_13]OGK48621.1 MAG: hypothetical protein A3A93_05395 [Candidatus Roizmanbacteria bacterium RIFCSPLOWO2_01_FULL_38_12]
MFSITAIVRSRGQLTIPGKVREVLDWPKSNTVVHITATADKKMIVEPFKGQLGIDWDKVWRAIRRSRSFKGKKGNLSKFIIEDREKH